MTNNLRRKDRAELCFNNSGFSSDSLPEIRNSEYTMFKARERFVIPRKLRYRLRKYENEKREIDRLAYSVVER